MQTTEKRNIIHGTFDIPPAYSKQALLISEHENTFKQGKHTFNLVYQNNDIRIYMRVFAPTDTKAASATKSSINIIPNYVDMDTMFPNIDQSLYTELTSLLICCLID